MKRQWLNWLVITSLSFITLPSVALEQHASVAKDLPVLEKVGAGRFTYWLWHLYDAELYSTNGQFADYQQSTPLKLSLTYARDITKKAFIDATVDQWQILQPTAKAQHQRWAKELDGLWRDVKEGDQLTAVLQPDGIIYFYFNREWLGQTSDAAMGPAFFDIWLSEATTAPELRKKLIAGSS